MLSNSRIGVLKFETKFRFNCFNTKEKYSVFQRKHEKVNLIKSKENVLKQNPIPEAELQCKSMYILLFI